MTTPAEILSAVYQATGTEPDEIISKSRRHSVLFPRYIVLLLLRQSRPFFSEIELGQLIGIEGHGSTRHALGKAKELLDQDQHFQIAHGKATAILGDSLPTATSD
jgi:chromosomal replication initiation ATPase DnaA